MPECKKCEKLIGDQCILALNSSQILGRELNEASLLGACEIAIVENYLDQIKPGMKVLEIGCGAWPLIKDHCSKVSAFYEGIDTLDSYFGKPSVATRFENLAKLSFEDNCFDIVIGNQTMEHWEEYGCKIEWGLYQCFRVCKEQGKVLLNVPIHYHGTKPFLLGDIRTIEKYFLPFSRTIKFEKWSSPSDPLPSYYPYPGYGKLKGKPAYILDIAAKKDIEIKGKFSNFGASKGWISRFMNNPPSYVVYRLLRRLSLRK